MHEITKIFFCEAGLPVKPPAVEQALAPPSKKIYRFFRFFQENENKKLQELPVGSLGAPWMHPGGCIPAPSDVFCCCFCDHFGDFLHPVYGGVSWHACARFVHWYAAPTVPSYETFLKNANNYGRLQNQRLVG